MGIKGEGSIPDMAAERHVSSGWVRRRDARLRLVGSSKFQPWRSMILLGCLGSIGLCNRIYIHFQEQWVMRNSLAN